MDMREAVASFRKNRAGHFIIGASIGGLVISAIVLFRALLCTPSRGATGHSCVSVNSGTFRGIGAEDSAARPDGGFDTHFASFDYDEVDHSPRTPPPSDDDVDDGVNSTAPTVAPAAAGGITPSHGVRGEAA